MPKPRVIFVCQHCGAQAPRWSGRCAECGEWNALVEEAAHPAQPAGRPALDTQDPKPISEVEPVDEVRIRTDIAELDRVLGGGAVVGSAILVGGEPGIGKSTLLLQAADRAAASGRTALYVTAEESALQTKLRAGRLGVHSDRLLLVSETNLDLILKHIEKVRPALVVVDSIQMVYTPDLPSAPGSVGQLRECATRLVYLAKRQNVSTFLVGHVTKDGTIAGPRTLEHMVDTVLYFEGDRFHSFRLLRAVKNRFGSTNEIAVFQMGRDGLREVANPSELFLSERRGAGAGSVVVPTVEGSRAILVEVQALIARAHYGMPERKVSGADYNRVCMLLAVLQRRAGLALDGHDVFVNVAGGVRIVEPAADLAVAAAIASSFENFAVPADVVMFGEVGLSGEVRGVTQAESRLREAARLGFKRAIIPADNPGPYEGCAGLEILFVAALSRSLDQLH